jgi:hypothetical protein
MINFLQYIYYHIYSSLLKKCGEDDAPKQTALLAIAGALMINIISLPFLIQVISGIDLLMYFHKIPKSLTILVATIFLISLYFLLIHKSRFKTIIEKYKDEPKATREKGILIAWIYIISSYLLLFGSAYVIFEKYSG